MAYVNVAEWKTDQVCEWLKGLDNIVLPYVHSFTNNCVNGQQLLNLRPEDLEQLGVLKLGHQEIILEAVEYLRNFHYELDRENLQLLALHLSCQAHSLRNELSRHTDSKPVATQTLSDVASVVTAVKPLVRWLDRPPFSGQLQYNDKKSELLRLSLEMATCAQRDRFAEKPIEEIRTTCEQLAKLADYIIQDIADPMILQPASLDLATLKKRPGDDLGFYILPSFHGNHQIAEIKFGSAAHTCGKMEEGDEIVQVNYQTVVGWERKNVLELFTESPAEVLLTLKRRPRHTKVYGQIYIKPYRLPSNKKTPYATRWQHNIPSPRPELLTIPDFTMPLPKHVPKEPSPEPACIIDTASMLDTITTDSSDSDSEVEPPLSVRLYATKPRNLVQRRATITGASPTTKHGIDIEQFWRELKQEHSTTFQLRDKAASCAHGLDTVHPQTQRPQTCLGIEPTKRKKRFDERSDDRKVQFNEKITETNNTRIHEIVETMSNDASTDATTLNNNNNHATLGLDKCEDNVETETTRTNDCALRCRKERGKLDKSHSTPAYDLTESNQTDISEIREQRTKTIDSESDSTSLIAIENQENRIFHDIENENENNVDSEIIRDNDEIGNDRLGNVAQRINHIESNMRNRDGESSNRSFVDDAKCRIFNDRTIRDDDEIVATDSNVANTNFAVKSIPISATIAMESVEFGRESSEEKSESTSSYVEENCSSGSDVDATTRESTIGIVSTDVNDDAILMPTTTTMDLTKISRFSEIDETAKRSNLRSSSRNDETEKSAVNDRESLVKRFGESSTTKTTIKGETKSRLTPPEPPPRKYFSKPVNSFGSSVKIVGIGSATDVREQPKLPERLDFRLETNRNDDSEVMTLIRRSDGFEGYRDFVEKSQDFIDDALTIANDRKIVSSSFVDHYGYTEINEDRVRDERTDGDRYESILEKFSNAGQTTNDHGPPEVAPRSFDSTDGSGQSRINVSADGRSKIHEKDKHCDKGVVNRAIMVARSMGLHGGSNKSSSGNSPRSSRKRNLLLAKRRNVSVKDVGPGDLEGWLTYRSKGAGGAWARSWFVLKSSSLYRFKAQDSLKSDCLIALSGFTASTAAEVKSRKYAFKVYHTGTVFYFAAETEDSLALWLDAINRGTFGADRQHRTSGLFSETDESDGETKNKTKGSANRDAKHSHESMFDSLKKIGRKDSAGYKDHEIGGASLDRKYLRFLGARNQNVPVPTAQFRSYRRVLPTACPSRKQDSTADSSDMRVTVAGSTFYGLSSSQSATDVPSTSQDMGDYRQTTDRSRSIRGRRSDDLRGFVTLEEFMLAHQSAERRETMSDRSSSPRITPLTSDHVHIQHRNFDDATTTSHGHVRSSTELGLSNGMIYGHPRNGEKSIVVVPPSAIDSSCEISRRDATVDRGLAGPSFFRKQENDATRRGSCGNEKKTFTPVLSSYNRKTQEGAVYYPNKNNDNVSHWQNLSNEITHEQQHRNYGNRTESCQGRFRRGENTRNDFPGSRIQSRQDNRCDLGSLTIDDCQTRDSIGLGDGNSGSQSVARRYVVDGGRSGYVGSNGDLTCCASSSETLERARKEASVSRRGSFNLTDRRRENHTPDKHWIDSLRRNEKKNVSTDKTRLKNVAQYQPPPMAASAFEQDSMRAAFEMHLDKSEHVHKTNRLKSLFGGNKSPQKPNTLDLPKESPKTLLGSPRLHRALFRDKSSSQTSRQGTIFTGNQSPGDSGISQSMSSYSGNSQSHTPSQSFSSASSVSDWSPDTPTPNSSKCLMRHATCQNRLSNSNRNSLTPPTLPYIPPPNSPPPEDYPGLEYPPVFEPGTYSLTDASIIRNRTKNIRNKGNRETDDAR